MIKFPLYVTLDTNIFVANKFDFSKNSTLDLLINYVEANKIKIVLSNIVIKEVEKHVIAESNSVCSSLRKLRAEVLKTASLGYLEEIGLDVPLKVLDKKQYEEKSQEVWKKFLKNIKPEILDTSIIDLDSIINDYFNFNPPFENNDKKRKEFPDAFIASQIKKRFGKEQLVAIVSNDKGFKEACGNFNNHIFFKTLGDLYNKISSYEKEYKEIIENINLLIPNCIPDIKTHIKGSDCVEVYGLSTDKDGKLYGFDYNDVKVLSVKNVTCSIRTIDEITENTIRATLLCKTDIDVECSYDDYDNAAWDHESRSFYFLEKIKNHEKHSAKFGIRIEVDRISNNLKTIPFKVILNNDTLCYRSQVYEEYGEMDLINQERENLGFCSLDQYSDFLENNLSQSAFLISVVKTFEKINNFYQQYEEIANIYDDLLTHLTSTISNDTIKQLTIKMKNIDGFPIIPNLDKTTNEEKDKIILWVNQSFDRLSELSEQKNLPDYFNYGEIIEIYNGKEIYDFVIGDFSGSPLPGDEELIPLSIKDNNGTIIANGFVKLTVGYLNFDEDGGAGDGMNDEIEYFCEDIINEIENIATFIGECVAKEWDIARKINEYLQLHHEKYQ